MKSARFVAALVFCIAGCSAVSAQDGVKFPSRTVRIVVSSSPGTSADVLARVIADKASAIWKQSVIVENRPGLPGVISVAKGVADGYTLLGIANGYAAMGALNKDLPFDTKRDLVGAAQIGTIPLVLVVSPESQLQSLNDLVASAKAKPGSLNYASVGLGSTSHLAAELFKRVADIDIQQVPYRGADTLTSVMRGDTQMTFVPVTTALELIKSNKLRALAVISPQRISALSAVPTFGESGYSNFTYNAWFGLLVPANTPKGVIDEFSRVAERILAEPDTKEALAKQGVTVEFAPPAAFTETIQSDIDSFNKLLSH